LVAARASWQRARQVADRLPDGATHRDAKRIAPRNMLCGSAWLAGGSLADTGFDELRELAEATGDKVSLATAMTGRGSSLLVPPRFGEASRLSTELIGLLDAIGDPTLTLGLLYSPLAIKYEVGEFAEVSRIAERMIELADGDIRRGDLVLASPLAGAVLL